jgi:formamidopyrimidine-DNA glycosylase
MLAQNAVAHFRRSVRRRRLIWDCFPGTLHGRYFASKESIVPELPEVENIALGLRRELVGQRVARVWVETAIIIRGPHRRQWRTFMVELTGRRIVRVTRRAKRLILSMEGGSALVVQLGMTGKFLLPPKTNKHPVLPKHTRMILSFRDGTLRTPRWKPPA